jgi:hypothetical protein
VEEQKPILIQFHKDFPVSAGKPKSTTIRVWQDAYSPTAPKYANGNVNVLVSLEANLSHLKKSDLSSTITRLADGNSYYRITGAVEATFNSASTKYTLLYRGMYTPIIL